MLEAQALAEKMLDSTYGATTREDAFAGLASTIEEYLLQNTEMTFNWTAQNADGSPDSVTAANGGIVSLKIDFSPFLNQQPDTAEKCFDLLSQSLINSLKLAMYNITDDGFNTAPASFSSAQSIDGLKMTPSGVGNREKSFYHMAKEIVTWMSGIEIVAPCVGNRNGTYIGQGV